MKKISITLLLFFIFNCYADGVLRPSINNESIRLPVSTKQAVEKKEIIIYKEDLTDKQKQMLIEALDNKLKNSHAKFSIIDAKFDFPPNIVKSNKSKEKVVYCALVNLKINDRYYHYEPFLVLMDPQKDYIVSYLDVRALGTTYYGKTRTILSEIIFAENPVAIIYAYSLEGYSIPKWKKHYKDNREDIYESCEQRGYDLREQAKKLSANKLVQNIYSIFE